MSVTITVATFVLEKVMLCAQLTPFESNIPQASAELAKANKKVVSVS